MIINTNMASLNTVRQLGVNEKATQSSLAKLSSGLRINSAADDAAGLAISEKMRGQISGLNKASSNAQDGISLVSTAEGALNETTSILQRMRELAVQAGNDTNTTTDRAAMQTEMNQLTSEVNRIGNTTEFNTQKLLNGNGSITLGASGISAGTGALKNGADAYKTEASNTDTFTAAAAATDTATYVLNGQTLVATFKANDPTKADNAAYNVTANAANVNIAATADVNTTAAGLAAALQGMIDNNDALKGGYTVTAAGANVTIQAVKGGRFDGSVAGSGTTAGTIDQGTMSGTAAISATAVQTVGTDVNAVQANTTLTMPAIDTTSAATADASAAALVGKGMTINGTAIEFYNSDNGAYTGKAQGIDISKAINEGTAANVKGDITNAIIKQAKIDGVTLSNSGGNLKVTANIGGTAGNDITAVDGGIQSKFEATFQIGANTGQTMTVQIGDMRSAALNISGTTASGTITATNGSKASLTAVKSASDGTSNTNIEYTLDISSADKATAAVSVIDDAINKVSTERANLGAYQNRLEHTINNLGTSSQNITSAEANIRDVDMAKEMTNFQKNNILQQAAQAMLAQANQQPQGVLQLLR